MELFLNSVWGLVAVTAVWFWLRHGKRFGDQRRLSLVALAMFVVILFPVISVSDDLWSLQYPAETDTCQKRDHKAASLHSNFPIDAALPEAAFVALTFEDRRLVELHTIRTVDIENPAFDSIQNRPPPAA